ncbi:hypothetical protein EXIGLDRAFT_781427 [Exidia glandulosa HHB12029]|uniref:Uncharacterized protein n=1 Tax=Exidia glandulosa HHB12029 TaxID=1314781 RepID=A0A165B942_EXIGL|nr:hypothetical protein EXIGLDRAFT_781427 [Exidia glandulosa HHB12029]
MVTLSEKILEVIDYFKWVVGAVDNQDVTLAPTVRPEGFPGIDSELDAATEAFYRDVLLPRVQELVAAESEALPAISPALITLCTAVHRFKQWVKPKSIPLCEADTVVLCGHHIPAVAHAAMALHLALIDNGILPPPAPGSKIVPPAARDLPPPTSHREQSTHVLYLVELPQSAGDLFTARVACHRCVAAGVLCEWPDPGFNCAACYKRKMGTCSVDINGETAKVSDWSARTAQSTPGFREPTRRKALDVPTLGSMKAEIGAAVEGVTEALSGAHDRQAAWTEQHNEYQAQLNLVLTGFNLLAHLMDPEYNREDLAAAVFHTFDHGEGIGDTDESEGTTWLARTIPFEVVTSDDEADDYMAVVTNQPTNQPGFEPPSTPLPRLEDLPRAEINSDPAPPATRVTRPVDSLAPHPLHDYFADLRQRQAITAAEAAEEHRLHDLYEAAAKAAAAYVNDRFPLPLDRGDPTRCPANMTYNPLISFAPTDEAAATRPPPEHYPFEALPPDFGNRCEMHKPFAAGIRYMARHMTNVWQGEGENEVPDLERARIALCGRTVRPEAHYRRETDRLFFDFEDTPTAQEALDDDPQAAASLDGLRFDFDSAYCWSRALVVEKTFKLQLPDDAWESVGHLPIQVPRRTTAQGDPTSFGRATATPTFKLGTFQPHGHVWVAFPNLSDSTCATVPEEYRKKVFSWVAAAAFCADPFSVPTILPNNQAAIKMGHKRDGLVLSPEATQRLCGELRESADRYCPGFQGFVYVTTIRGTKQQTCFFEHDPVVARDMLGEMLVNIAAQSLESDQWSIDKGLEWKRGDCLLHPRAGAAPDLLHALFPTVPLDVIRDGLTQSNTRIDVTALIYAFQCFSVDTSGIAQLRELVANAQVYSTIKHLWYNSSPTPKGIWVYMQSKGLLNASALDHGITNTKRALEQIKYAEGFTEAAPDRGRAGPTAPVRRHDEEPYAFAVRQTQHEQHQLMRSSSLRFEVTVPYRLAIGALSHITVAALAPHVYCVPLIHLWQWYHMRVTAALLVLENLQQQPPAVRLTRGSLVLGGLVTAILKAMPGRPPEGGSYDEYFERCRRVSYNRVVNGPDIVDNTVFWIPDIQEIPGGHWVVPIEVADLVPAHFLATSYGVETLAQLQLNVTRHAHPVRRTVLGVAGVRTQSRRVESALDAIRGIADVVLDECQAAVDAAEWERLERVYDETIEDPRRDPRYHTVRFLERARLVEDINTAIWQHIVMWVKNAHNRFPSKQNGDPYAIMTKAEIDRRIVGIALMQNVDFRERLRCAVVADASTAEQRQMFECHFGLQVLDTTRKVGQGYSTWGSLKAYAVLLTNVSMPEQRELIIDAVWRVWQTFHWVPWSTRGKIYATGSATSLKYKAVGLREDANAPRLALFPQPNRGVVQVAEEDRAGMARQERDRQRELKEAARMALERQMKETRAAETARWKRTEKERVAEEKARKEERQRLASEREALQRRPAVATEGGARKGIAEATPDEVRAGLGGA